MPRIADLDMNQHVNNVTYIGWVLESMPQEIIDTHELLNNHFGLYKGMSTTATATTADHDWRSFLHLLSLSSDRLEINHGRTEWRKKPAR